MTGRKAQGNGSVTVKRRKGSQSRQEFVILDERWSRSVRGIRNRVTNQKILVADEKQCVILSLGQKNNAHLSAPKSKMSPVPFFVETISQVKEETKKKKQEETRRNKKL